MISQPRRISSGDILLVFIGSFFALIAYFFVKTPTYTVFTTIGGVLMLSPLLRNLTTVIRFAFKIRSGQLGVFTIFFSGIALWLRAKSDGLNSDMLLVGDLYQFSLAFLFFLVGLSVQFSEIALSKIIAFYGLGVSILSFFLMKYAGGGFAEISLTYTVASKNSLCVGWAIAGAMLFWVYFYGYKTQFLKWICICGFFGIIVCLLYARARTAFLALTAFCIITLYKKFGKGRWYLGIVFFIVFGLIVSGFLYFFGLPQVVTESFVANKDEGDLNSISSGRIELMQMGINGFLSHPFWGCGDFNGSMPIHCYPLRVLSGRGILGAFGYMLFYFYLWGICIKKIMSKDRVLFGDICVYGLLILLIDSLGEITMPYGPGTISAICFILLGSHTRRQWELPTLRIAPVSAYATRG